MARFRKRKGEDSGLGEQQLGLFERLESLTHLVEAPDPRKPAVKLLCVVLAMMGLGLLMQASHAATVFADARAFRTEVMQQSVYRVMALGVLLVGYWVGPVRLRPALPVLVVISALMLVACGVPGLEAPQNGSHRWIIVPFTDKTVQPSEIARLVLVIWVADRCVRLGPRLHEFKRGVLPIMLTALFFVALIGSETDLGGALVFLGVFTVTWWVGGASKMHFVWSACAIGVPALVLAISSKDYIQRRLEVFLGVVKNQQVESSIEALGSGELLGVGLGQGQWRTNAMPYQDSDYFFALIGEELGFVGMVLCAGLAIAFLWFSLRIVLSISDRYQALAAFGLLLGVGVQGMVHMQVVTGLAPPKGMTLPFMSDGGTSLLVSSLAVGLALGAVRRQGPQPVSLT
jgi:cell division protein FtsW